MNYLTDFFFFCVAAGPMRNGWYNWAEPKEETKTLIDTLYKSTLNLTLTKPPHSEIHSKP
jgi:hypothetical protein